PLRHSVTKRTMIEMNRTMPVPFPRLSMSLTMRRAARLRRLLPVVVCCFLTLLLTVVAIPAGSPAARAAETEPDAVSGEAVSDDEAAGESPETEPSLDEATNDEAMPDVGEEPEPDATHAPAAPALTLILQLDGV